MMKIKLQELGEGIEEAEVIAISVKEGDKISRDQTLLELETGKATIEVPSPSAGTIKAVLVSEGDKITVGTEIVVLETEDETGDEDEKTSSRKEPEKEKEQEEEEEQEEESGDEPSAEEKDEEEGSEAEADGEDERRVKDKEELKSSKKTARAVGREVPEESRGAGKTSSTALSGMKPAKNHIPIAAAPSVRVFAREIGIAIEEVSPGDGERVTMDDVKRHAKRLNESRNGTGGEKATEPPLPDFSQWGAVETETMSGVRAAISAHMTRCWTTIPHVTQHDMADVTELDALRRRFASRVPEGVKLTLTAILLKITAAALKVFPKFNASIDGANKEIIYKKYMHVGVAVDTPKGLLVPVIRDADKKNIIDIAVEMNELATKARKGKLGLEAMKGGTFTLTNLGGIGGSFFTPIINAPEVAILGVGRAISSPVCGPEELCRPRLMLPLSLSYDHRLIDGADGARFLRWIIEAIEEPLLISLEG